MRQNLSHLLGLIALGVAGVAASPADAATSNGPYYATPSWDQKLPASTRFVVLSDWNNEAVMDRETGLVWEKSPNTSSTFSWIQASSECIVLFKGNRYGWRLPVIQELMSLVDPSVPVPGPRLPPGHPFENVQVSNSSLYWSSTSVLGDPTAAHTVIFRFGSLSDPPQIDPHLVWCVRGGQGVDAQ